MNRQTFDPFLKRFSWGLGRRPLSDPAGRYAIWQAKLGIEFGLPPVFINIFINIGSVPDIGTSGKLVGTISN